MVDLPPVPVVINKTATSDAVFKVVYTDVWLEFGDVFIITNNAYMGDNNSQTVPIYANDIYSFPYPVNLNDLFFKNYTAGSNTVIVIIGTTLTNKKAKEYGIVLPP